MREDRRTQHEHGTGESMGGKKGRERAKKRLGSRKESESNEQRVRDREK